MQKINEIEYVGVIKPDEPGPFAHVRVHYPNGDSIPLPPRHDLAVHISHGYSWGHERGGAQQLALAILAHHLDDERTARLLTRAFTREAIAELQIDKGFRLRQRYIEDWIRQHPIPEPQESVQ